MLINLIVWIIKVRISENSGCEVHRTEVHCTEAHCFVVYSTGVHCTGVFFLQESVLNGRLEPCGHVEGFTAEVGASGAFCPPHIILPVNAAFYSLHDNHGGTSPYLVRNFSVNSALRHLFSLPL